MKYSILTLLLLFVGTGTSYGQAAGGLRFLERGADPLSLGMSETKTAVLLGAPSIFSNPANLALDEASSLSATHTFWIAGSRNILGAVNFRNNQNAFAFGVYTSLIDDIQARSVPGSPNGSFSWQYYAFAGSVSQRVGPLSVGITGMYLYEQVELSSASGYAFHVGASTELLDKRVRIGTVAQSIGKMNLLNATRSELPGQFKLGTDVQAIQFSVPGETNIPVLVSLAADLVVPIEWIDQEQFSFENHTNFFQTESDAWVNLGLRTDISDFLNLRFGYTTAQTSRPFSTGLGIRRFGVEADIAFIPFNDGFGSAVSFGLRYAFNQ
jgi:hypothetical protein